MGCGSSQEIYTMGGQPILTAYPSTPRGTSGFGIATAGMGTDWSGFELHTLQQHNDLRTRHSSPALCLRRDLCDLAQEFANDLSMRGVLEHSPLSERCLEDVQCGENLYSNTNTSPREVSADAATCSWYCESCLYDFSKGGIQEGTANFTQMLWKETHGLGVGATFIRQGAWYTVTVVALYYPAGNYVTRISDNVLPAIEESIYIEAGTEDTIYAPFLIMPPLRTISKVKRHRPSNKLLKLRARRSSNYRDLPSQNTGAEL